jgi:hypothetical protein
MSWNVLLRRCLYVDRYGGHGALSAELVCTGHRCSSVRRRWPPCGKGKENRVLGGRLGWNSKWPVKEVQNTEGWNKNSAHAACAPQATVATVALVLTKCKSPLKVTAASSCATGYGRRDRQTTIATATATATATGLGSLGMTRLRPLLTHPASGIRSVRAACDVSAGRPRHGVFICGRGANCASTAAESGCPPALDSGYDVGAWAASGSRATAGAKPPAPANGVRASRATESRRPPRPGARSLRCPSETG